MRPLPLLALLFALSGALALGAPQQSSVERGPIISVETDLVMLPVTVLDRHGAFVPGLTQADFTVYDNGEPQMIQFLTGEDIPATIGLLIDSSGSMREVRDHVTAAGAAFAEASHPLDELFIVSFNERVWAGLPTGVDFAQNPDQLRAALARAPAVGLTALYDALHVALDRLQGGTRDRKVLIVVSDGGDNASTHTFASVLARAQGASVIIHTVALIDPADHDARPGVLKDLARVTGGEALRPEHVEDVVKVFTRLAQEIRSGYTIGYAPPEAPAGGFRTVRVVARARDHGPLTVRTREGYYARPAPRGP